MAKLTDAHREFYDRYRHDSSVSAMLDSLGRRFRNVLDLDDIESLKDWAVLRTAQSHQEGRQSVKSSVRTFWDWEVKRLLAERLGGRSVSATETLQHGDDVEAADDSSAASDDLLAVFHWMSTYLSRKAERAVRLRYLHQMNLADVGASLGVSERTAGLLVAGAIEKLRQLGGVGGFAPDTAITEGD